MNRLNCWLLFLGIIIQKSESILIEREDFDKACSNINRLISQGINLDEAIRRSINELQAIKDKKWTDSLELEETGSLNKQIVQSSDPYNWLFSLFSGILGSSAVNVKLEGTNSSKVNIVGKRELNSYSEIPCESIPFQSFVGSNDKQSVQPTLLSINDSLSNQFN